MRHSKIVFVTGSLVVLVIFFVQCASGGRSNKDPRGKMFAGPASCAGCHKDVFNSYIHTNHMKTSGLVNTSNLSAFINDSNKTAAYSATADVTLEKRDARWVQTYRLAGKEQRSEIMSIAFGSAEKAQTYAYWKGGNLLFQLPLTYFTSLNRWTNSPGFPSNVYYDRVVLARCFECHASYVEKEDFQSGPLQVSEKINPASIIYGIDCERCHGPAAEHVQFHTENPDVKQARFMRVIKSMTRQQKIDVCGACHSGNDLDVQRSLFEFMPGDTLANFFYPHFGSGGNEPDVHGKQVQLLQLSKCFRQSEMICGTCHDPHQQEENMRAVFVSKCMSCHQSSQHAGDMMTNEKSCMDCHMPLQASKVLQFNDGKQTQNIPYLLRTHRIAIYTVLAEYAK